MSENINKLKDLFLSFQKEEQVMITYTAAAAAKSLQSCLTLCDPIDGSLPGSSIRGIFQARVLEWGAIAFSDYYIYYQLQIRENNNFNKSENLHEKYKSLEKYHNSTTIEEIKNILIIVIELLNSFHT